MISAIQLRKQFDRALKLGWVQHALDAEKATGFSAALSLAIGSRETNLDPRYCRIPGDNGNGFGIHQFDRRVPRYNKEVIATGKWQDPRFIFFYTAREFNKLRLALRSIEGQPIAGRFRSGQEFHFIGNPIPDTATLVTICVAGWNCGLKTAYYHYSKGRSVDTGTTGKDYSADVQARYKLISLWIKQSANALAAAQTQASALPTRDLAVHEQSESPSTDDDPPSAYTPEPAAVVEAMREPLSLRFLLKRARMRIAATLITTWETVHSFLHNLTVMQKLAVALVVASVVILLVESYIHRKDRHAPSR